MVSEARGETGGPNRSPRSEIRPAVSANRKKEPVLLLDLSTSMDWGAAGEYGPEWPDPGSRRAIVIEALHGLVRVLEDEDSEAAAEQASGSDEQGGLMAHGFGNRHVEIGDEEFGDRDPDEQPVMLTLVVTDGEAGDWMDFEPVMEKATAKRVFVVAIVGHGRKHDATLAAYQQAARKNADRDKFGKVTPLAPRGRAPPGLPLAGVRCCCRHGCCGRDVWPGIPGLSALGARQSWQVGPEASSKQEDAMKLLTLSARRLIGVTSLACAAALVPVAACAVTGSSSAPAAASKPAAASTPECATSGLVVWMDTVGQGYAGGVSYTLKFTNLSGHACTLYGYPGVWAVTLSGRRIGASNTGGTIKPTTVTLANGATATSTLQITDPANFGTACFLPGQSPAPGRPGKLPTAAGLHVEPPNPHSFTYKVIPFPFSACYSSSAGPVYLHTTPVQK